MKLGYLRIISCGRRRRRRCAYLSASAIFFASLPGNAYAQSSPPPPLPPTREEVTRPVAPTQPPPSKLEVEGGIERAPCALDGPEFRSIHFVLRTADFEGLQGLTADQIAAAYAPFVGRDVPISTVCEIRDRAATMLRNAGYIAAVQVPQQRIENGTVKFQVLMARLTAVRVRGEATGAETILAAYLNQLTKRPLFNRYEAERYLLLASDLPGYTVRLTLRPAGDGVPGDVVGDVTVQRLPAYADFVVQNGGSQALGPWGGLARAQFFGLTGLGDRTSVSFYSTADLHEQQTIQLAHEMRIGPEGLTLGGAFTYAWARPTVHDAHVLAKTLLGTAELGYPFVRTQAETIRGSVGMDVINQDVWFRTNQDTDFTHLTRDRLRVGFVRLGADIVPTRYSNPAFSSAEPPWHFSGLLELRHGFHALGATRCGIVIYQGFANYACPDVSSVPPSRLGGHSNATVLRYTFNGEVRPIPKLTFALTARAQYSGKAVMSFEEFAAGNYTSGRGYDPGALLGDSGVGTQAEIRYGSRIPVSAGKPAVEGYAFWDHVEVRHHGSPIIVTEREHLNSIGAGARANWNRFVVDAALALPLTHVGSDNRKPPVRFLVSLTTRLWPWKY